MDQSSLTTTTHQRIIALPSQVHHPDEEATFLDQHCVVVPIIITIDT
jgi:hypothetical protein